ncbi:MAG: hypothetical protein HN337_04120 [Deltaproteobacteria bacterium]|jgi:hypothetical protein|nr:hypothetical protein [Deltaproteobacteria bacterium]
MKYQYLLAIALSIVLLGSTEVGAEIKSSDLTKQVTLTEEAALLTQVDAVSLYMSSDKVAFAPRLNNANIIEVETTVLDNNLLANSSAMQGFVTRTIDSFVSVLQERLPIYAPSVASKFRKNGDVKFMINAGGERKPVAMWYAGKWYWDKAWTPYAAPVVNYGVAPYRAVPNHVVGDVAAQAKGKLGCNCPARR